MSGSDNKKGKIIGNMGWRFAERCGAQGVAFIVSIILARLLDPSVYGTVALLTVFITILNVFVDSGLGNALIQKKNADSLDFSTVFIFNVIMCSVLYACLFFAAPLIADFYKDPSLTPLMRVLGITLVIAGVKNIQQAYVSKNLLFKKFFYATLGGTVVAAIVGITLAYKGFGAWALVAQHVVNTAVDTLVLYITIKWRPKLQFSFKRFKGLFSYGWKMLVSSLLDKIYNDIRQLIIGKHYSSEDLAFYNQGKRYPSFLINNINSSLDSVLLPVMSQSQDNKNHVKAITRRLIKISTYIMAPMMIGLAVCAEPFIRVFLTDKWLPAAFYLRIFCITFIFYPIHTANLNAIQAMGRSDWFLRLEIVKKIVGFVLLFSTIFISVEAMAYSLLLGTLTSTIINAYPNKKLLNYSWAEQMKDILPNILLGLAMSVPVFFLQWLPLPTYAVLALQIIVGAIIYIGLSAILKLEAFTYLLDTLKGFIKNHQDRG